MPLKPCVNTIIDFFEFLDRETFHLCAIHPTKKNRVKTAAEFGIDNAVSWCEEWNERGYNVYYQPNTPKDRFTRRAKDEDIKLIRFAHLDLDLPSKGVKDREQWLEDAADRVCRLKGVKGEPYIVMSGNGLQVLWPLETPLKATPENVERLHSVNKRIMAEVETGGGTWNISRLLRVPGLVNYPNQTKIDKGYKKTLAEIWHDADNAFTLSSFDKLTKELPKYRQGAPDGKWRIDYRRRSYSKDYEPLSFDELLAIDPFALDVELDTDDEEVDNGRSGQAFRFIKNCLRALCYHWNEEAVDIENDPDIAKNVAQLTEETDAEFLGHYDDKGWPKLGYDIHRAMWYLIDEAPQNGKRRRAKKEARQASEARFQAGVKKGTVLTHRRDLILHFEACMELDDYPNISWTGANGDIASPSQQATESNVRALFKRAGVAAKWDVMRERPQYDIKERAGKPLPQDTPDEGEARRTAPREHFQAALAHVPDTARHTAAESLLLDCFHNRGLRARRELPELMHLVARDELFHPLEDYCTSVPWDGKRRIAALADCLTSDHPLKEVYMHIFFRQCVAAVCSLQTFKAGGRGEMIGSVLVLVGPQGLGKSSFLEQITPPGFLANCDAGLKLGGFKEEDSMRAVLSGLVAVLNEIGSSMDRSQAEALKNFITSPFDEFRVAYAREPISKPRMTQLAGTSNDFRIKDQTGSRRFLGMDVTAIDFKALERVDLQQCYAEAWHDVMHGDEVWWLDKKQERKRDAYNNARYREIPEEEDAIATHVETLKHDDSASWDWLSVGQVLKALDLKYTAHRVRMAAKYLDVAGLSTDTESSDHKLYFFPMLPHHRANLR